MRVMLDIPDDGVHGTLKIDNVSVPICVRSMRSEVRCNNYEITTMGMHGRQYTKGPEEHEITIVLLCAGKASELTEDIRRFNDGSRSVRLDE